MDSKYREPGTGRHPDPQLMTGAALPLPIASHPVLPCLPSFLLPFRFSSWKRLSTWQWEKKGTSESCTVHPSVFPHAPFLLSLLPSPLCSVIVLSLFFWLRPNGRKTPPAYFFLCAPPCVCMCVCVGVFLTNKKTRTKKSEHARYAFFFFPRPLYLSRWSIPHPLPSSLLVYVCTTMQKQKRHK